MLMSQSLSLIRGRIDQIASTVDITWVQPRVLDSNQLETLAAQFKSWTEAVGRTEGVVNQLRQDARTAVSVA